MATIIQNIPRWMKSTLGEMQAAPTSQGGGFMYNL